MTTDRAILATRHGRPRVKFACPSLKNIAHLDRTSFACLKNRAGRIYPILHASSVASMHARVAWAVAEEETEEERGGEAGRPRDGFQIFERREGGGQGLPISSPACETCLFMI